VLLGSRDGQRMGDWKMIDTMIVDGLWDVYNQYHMGITAENVAKAYGITREMQDALALASQQKAAAAQDAGKFKDEIVAVSASRRRRATRSCSMPTSSSTSKTNAEALAGLRPAFDKAGSVTAGNASGINDGAAAVVVMSAKKAAALGLTPLARIASFATSGLDPATMGMGPVPASRKALAARRLEGGRPGPVRAQRGLCRPGLRRQQGNGLDPARSTSTAAPLPSATRSARPAAASW
jgi:acetyl-CoA C-acetyltransferase